MCIYIIYIYIYTYMYMRIYIEVRFAQKSAFKTVNAFACMEVLTKNILISIYKHIYIYIHNIYRGALCPKLGLRNRQRVRAYGDAHQEHSNMYLISIYIHTYTYMFIYRYIFVYICTGALCAKVDLQNRQGVRSDGGAYQKYTNMYKHTSHCIRTHEWIRICIHLYMQVRFAQKSAFKTVKKFARMEVLTKNIQISMNVHLNTHMHTYKYTLVYIYVCRCALRKNQPSKQSRRSRGWRCSQKTFTSKATVTTLDRCVMYKYIYM